MFINVLIVFMFVFFLEVMLELNKFNVLLKFFFLNLIIFKLWFVIFCEKEVVLLNRCKVLFFCFCLYKRFVFFMIVFI